MGTGQSTLEQQEQLPITTHLIEPQPSPICATETRFCLPHNVKLHLNCPESEDDFVFTDANDRRILYFHCNGHDYSGCLSLDLGTKKYLKDNLGTLVFFMKRKKCGTPEEFNLFADAKREKHICKLKGHIGFMKLSMSTEFSDISNDGIQRQLWMKGDLFTDCNIYLGDPTDGGVLLARMVPRSKAFWSAVEFTIEIAANIDVALIAMICIAAEQHCRDRKKAITKRY